MSSRRTWAERTCIDCGAVYEFDTSEVGKRSWLAIGKASAAAEPACPECGCIPPVAVAARKRILHFLPAVAWVVGGGLTGMFGAINTAISYSTAGLILGVAALLVWVAHAVIVFTAPNRHRERNALRSRRLEQLGLLGLVDDPAPDRAGRGPRAVSGWSYLLLLLGVVGVLLCFTPFVQKATHTWPENPGVKPEVIGPGDTVRVWVPDHIHAVNGKWNGTPRAVMVVEGEPDPFALPATAARDYWGERISGKSVRDQPTTLWADVKVPN
jgi:hypothetical protein